MNGAERAKRLREKNLTKFGKKCCKCGSNYSLEFAHVEKTEVTGRGRGSYYRAVDVRDHPECYILLCRKCHKLFDSGLLVLAPVIVI